MSTEQLKKYLKQHRELEEPKYRRLGGGNAGCGHSAWRGEKEVNIEYLV